MPSHDLMELVKRLNDEAEQVLVGKGIGLYWAQQQQSPSVSR